MSFPPADPDSSEAPIHGHLAARQLFSSLPEAARREVGGLARRARYEARQGLFRVGDASDWVFVLCAGHVRATVTSSDGRELVLHVAGPGEAPGFLDIVGESPRSADAVAVDDVEVLVLPTQAVRATLLEHPHALMQRSADLATPAKLCAR